MILKPSEYVYLQIQDRKLSNLLNRSLPSKSFAWALQFINSGLSEPRGDRGGGITSLVFGRSINPNLESDQNLVSVSETETDTEFWVSVSVP